MLDRAAMGLLALVAGAEAFAANRSENFRTRTKLTDRPFDTGLTSGDVFFGFTIPAGTVLGDTQVNFNPTGVGPVPSLAFRSVAASDLTFGFGFAAEADTSNGVGGSASGTTELLVSTTWEDELRPGDRTRIVIDTGAFPPSDGPDQDFFRAVGPQVDLRGSFINAGLIDIDTAFSPFGGAFGDDEISGSVRLALPGEAVFFDSETEFVLGGLPGGSIAVRSPDRIVVGGSDIEVNPGTLSAAGIARTGTIASFDIDIDEIAGAVFGAPTIEAEFGVSSVTVGPTSVGFTIGSGTNTAGIEIDLIDIQVPAGVAIAQQHAYQFQGVSFRDARLRDSSGDIILAANAIETQALAAGGVGFDFVIPSTVRPGEVVTFEVDGSGRAQLDTTMALLGALDEFASLLSWSVNIAGFDITEGTLLEVPTFELDDLLPNPFADETLTSLIDSDPDPDTLADLLIDFAFELSGGTTAFEPFGDFSQFTVSLDIQIVPGPGGLAAAAAAGLVAGHRRRR